VTLNDLEKTIVTQWIRHKMGYTPS